jgi:hypothetical protein
MTSMQCVRQVDWHALCQAVGLACSEMGTGTYIPFVKQGLAFTGLNILGDW